MRTTGSILVLLAAVCGQLPAEKKPRTSIEQQLQPYYVPARIAPDRVSILQPGSVLVVQKPGLRAFPAPFGSFGNSYKESKIHHGFLDNMLIAGSNPRPFRELQPGEQVFLLKADFKDSNISFQVQTCGSCDLNAPDPNHIPHRASVNFQFTKQYLEKGDVGYVQMVLGQVFGVVWSPGMQAQPQQPQGPPPPIQLTQQSTLPPPADAPPPQPQAQFPVYQTAPQDQPQAQAPPPAPQQQPTAEPIQIGLGQTTEQVQGALGAPEKIVKLGSKEIYIYKDLKVTFVDGKVTDVQ